MKSSSGSTIFTANQTAPSGSELTANPPEGTMRIGDTYTWSMHACESGSCSDETSAQNLILDPLEGAGQRSFFTYDTFSIDQALQAKVNVGSGDLLLNSSDLNLIGITNTMIGESYNSLAWAPGSPITEDSSQPRAGGSPPART